MARLGLVAWMVLGCASSGDEAVSSARRCERLRDHLVELRLADTAGVDREAHGKALRAALGESFVDACKTSLTGAQVSCALAANDISAATSCQTKR